MSHLSTILGAVSLECDGRWWTLTVDGKPIHFKEPHTFQVGLEVAASYLEHRFHIDSVQWADAEGPRAYSGRWIVHSWKADLR